MFHFDSYLNNIACICSSGDIVSYRELNEIADKICRNAESHKLVFCLCNHTVGAIAGYVAFLRNNDCSLLLDSDISKESLNSLLDAYHPKYIWSPINRTLPNCQIEDKVFEGEGYILYKTNNDTLVSDNLAVLLATSGSTGSPKLIRLSKDNLRSNATSIIEYLNITDKERPILGLPMNYAYGLSIVNSHLMVGATLLLTKASFIEYDFWKFANKNGFTSYSGVPYSYEIIKRLDILKQSMPTLRTLTQAGGTMDKKLVLYFSEYLSSRSIKFYKMYGQAEATARISYLDPVYINNKADSIGKAIPGGKLTIVDESGIEITDHNTIGELVYEGSNVSLGYAECVSDLMKSDENRGVVHTGDLAYRDSEGFYYIVGRKSRFVKLFGHRISLDHIETLLRPLLTEYACVGDDSHLSIYTTDAVYDRTKVINMLSSRTKIPLKAFSLCHIDRMPRTKSGKILYHELSNNGK